MKWAELNSHCDQLCNQLHDATDPTTAAIARKLINVLHENIIDNKFTLDDYTWLFLNIAALSYEITRRISGYNTTDFDEDDFNLIKSKLIGAH